MSTLTIGEVIEALESAKPDGPVHFDFCGLVPTTVDSWRGIYAEAALGFENAEGIAPTAQQLLCNLREAIDGREFTGWKGGDYRYTSSTPLHVDNPGRYTNTAIDRIEVDDWRVILHTKQSED